MRRIFNKYGACDHPGFMSVADKASEELVSYARDNGIDMHDALSVAAMSLTARFAEEYLLTGVKLKCEEKKKEKEQS